MDAKSPELNPNFAAAEADWITFIQHRVHQNPESALFARKAGDPLIDVRRMRARMMDVAGNDDLIAEFLNSCTENKGDDRRSAKNFLSLIMLAAHEDDSERAGLVQWVMDYKEEVVTPPKGFSLNAAKSLVDYYGTERYLINMVWLTQYLKEGEDTADDVLLVYLTDDLTL